MRSARRQTVRARCKYAEAALPPGRMKDFSGSSSALSLSISALEPGNLRVGDGQPRAARALFGEAEIGLDVEQVVLDARERGIERLVRRGVQPHQPDHRVDFVDGAVGLHAQVVFLAPRAGAERGGAVVAGAGIDAVEQRPWPAGPFAGPRNSGLGFYLIGFWPIKTGGDHAIS